jgi:hypothetical protein
MQSPFPFDIHAHILAHSREGLARRISEACGLHVTAVHKWHQVPPWHLETVSAVIGIAPEILRPDIFERMHRPPGYLPLPKWLRTALKERETRPAT